MSETNGNHREGWTDERLDRLADSVSELRESVTELRESVTEIRGGITELHESVIEIRGGITELHETVTELREGLAESKDSIDGVRLTAQALLQIAAQHQQAERVRQEEIQEVRLEIIHINERLDVQQGQIKILLERLLSN